ncbi:MAG: transglycosylase domain-containing protein [Chitinophagales bacterium]
MAKTKLNFNNFWQVFRIVQLTFWTLVLFIVLFFVGIDLGLLGEMPDLRDIQDPKNDISTTVYSSDGEVLGSYFKENRIEVSYDELSPYLVKALVATEDKRFYDHAGVDLKGLFRVFVRTGIMHQDAGGGSTISQQLAKNLFHQDFQRAGKLKRVAQKLKEWVLAAKIERTFTKDEIVNLYFNTIGFGYNSYGIKTASFTYFYKQPKELKVEEAAMLVAMLNGPTYFNPRKHEERTRERRNLVLARMVEQNFITQQQYDSVKLKPIKLNFHNPDYREGLATYFREYLRQELKNWCEKNRKGDGSKYDISRDGLKVYTTIDSRMQRYAEEGMREHLKELQATYFRDWKGKEPWKFGSRAKPELLNKMMKETARYADLKAQGKSDAEIQKIFNTKIEMTIFSYDGDNGSYDKDTTLSPMDSLRYYLQIIQTGFLAADVHTGEIKAWIGGPNISYFQLDHAKKTTKRQVGSTMKPLQYAVAIEHQYEPCHTILYQAPGCGDNGWNPDGSKHWKEGDEVPMQEGLWYSDNKVTANLMCDFGPQALVDMARKLGIESPLDAVPSLCLGVSDISLMEMVGAYSAFANLGIWSKPYFIKKITDKNGNTLAVYGDSQREALTEQVAYTTTEMMKGVINHGTGTRLRNNYGLKDLQMAGKTGTTQSNADAWFMCITPDLVTGCWVGFEQPSVHFTSAGQGATAALPIVGKFLNRSYGDYKLKLNRKAGFPMLSDSTVTINFDCSKKEEEE